jgi:selenoprotein W-related protein
LIPSDGGRFEVMLDDQMVFSKKQLGRHAEDGEVLKLMQERVPLEE